MKQITSILLILTLLVACNRTRQKDFSDEEKLNLLKSANDSLVAELDSLMSLKVALPQLLDSTVFSVECMDQFNRLAVETGGQLKVVANSKFVSSVIKDIIDENGVAGLDLMVIIDKTGSMADDIANIQLGLDQILATLEGIEGVRLSVATYGDRIVDGTYWFGFEDFGQNLNKSREFVNSIKVTGGGDYPESVYDGIYGALQKDFWKSGTKRIIVLLGDAPSHVEEMTDHSLDEIIAMATAESINMNFYPIVLSPYDTEMGTIETMQSLSFIESVYPNPSPGLVHVKFNQINEFALELYDQNGSLVRTFPVSGTTISLDLYDLEAGLYVLRAVDDKKNFDVKKIVIKR